MVNKEPVGTSRLSLRHTELKRIAHLSSSQQAIKTAVPEVTSRLELDI